MANILDKLPEAGGIPERGPLDQTISLRAMLARYDQRIDAAMKAWEVERAALKAEIAELRIKLAQVTAGGTIAAGERGRPGA